MVNYAASRDTCYFELWSNSWKMAPELNQARFYNSSCMLGNFAYTFAGNGRNNTFINSIEKLDFKSMIDGDTDAVWNLI